jgi:hypothetical protein
LLTVALGVVGVLIVRELIRSRRPPERITDEIIVTWLPPEAFHLVNGVLVSEGFLESGVPEVLSSEPIRRPRLPGRQRIPS